MQIMTEERARYLDEQDLSFHYEHEGMDVYCELRDRSSGKSMVSTRMSGQRARSEAEALEKAIGLFDESAPRSELEASKREIERMKQEIDRLRGAGARTTSTKKKASEDAVSTQPSN